MSGDEEREMPSGLYWIYTQKENYNSTRDHVAFITKALEYMKAKQQKRWNRATPEQQWNNLARPREFQGENE